MAINFDGTAGSIDCGTNDDILNENIPLSIYVRFNINTVAAGGYRMVFRASAIGLGDGITFNVANSGTNGLLEFEVAAVTATYASSNVDSVLPNTEYAAVVTWDGTTTASGIHFYLNSSVDITNPLSLQNGTLMSDTSGQNTYIGKRADNGAGKFFPGIIREVAIFNRVIETNYISDLTTGRLYANNRNQRNVPLTVPGCVRYFRIDGGSAGAAATNAIITDYSKTNVSGIASTGTTWVDEITIFDARFNKNRSDIGTKVGSRQTAGTM